MNRVARLIAGTLLAFWPVILIGQDVEPGAPVDEAQAAPAATETPPAAPVSQPAAAQPDQPVTPAPAPTPPEIDPYRIGIVLAFDNELAWTPALRSDVVTEIDDLVKKTFGQMWQVEFETSPSTAFAGRPALERMTADVALAEYGDSKFDKVFCVAIAAEGPRTVVAAREWDAASHELSTVHSSETWQSREIGQCVYRLLRDLFHPVLVVDGTLGDVIELRLRAGCFRAIDPQVEQVRVGDFLLPLNRVYDRNQKLRSVSFHSWTYLRVESVNQQYVSAKLISGLSNPIRLKSRRIQNFALRVRPEFDQTEIKLMRWGRHGQPMVGVQVDALAKTFANDRQSTEPTQLISDRHGIVRLERSSEQPIYWIYVLNGGALLARAPVVPGLRQADTLTLLDNSMRLNVETEVALLKGRVVDAVARRVAHILRAAAAADEGKWDEVNAELALLDKVPGTNEFRQQLNAIRIPALEAADLARNKSARSAIENICGNAQGVIDRHLASSTLADKLENIRALREKAGAAQPADPNAAAAK